MFVPLRLLTLRTSCLYLFVYIYSQVYMYSIINTFVYEPKLCNSNPYVPLQVLTLRTSLDTYIYSQVYTYHISDTFVYQPMLCELTSICFLASAHLLKVFLYIHIFTSKDRSYCRYLCILTQVVQTYICLSPCERSYLEPLCIHAHTQKYTFVILQIFLYMNLCCATLRMSVPLRVLALRTLPD